MTGVAEGAVTPASQLPSPIRPSEKQAATAKRTLRTLARRRTVNTIMVGLLVLSAVLATIPLLLILWHLLKSGASSLSWNFFTKEPASVGESGGGMYNAIVGTLMLVVIASAIGLPVGVGAGLYLV